MQAGYQKGKATQDQISILINILEDRKIKPESEICVVLIDIIKFFDSVEHWLIKQTLEDYGIPNKFVQVIMSLYKDNQAFIITPHGDSAMFSCTRGMRQGDTLSPILSILILNPIITYIKNRYKGYSFKNNDEIEKNLITTQLSKFVKACEEANLSVVTGNSIPKEPITLNPITAEHENFQIEISSNTLFCWTDGSKNERSKEVGLGVHFKVNSKYNIYKKLHESIDINEAEINGY